MQRKKRTKGQKTARTYRRRIRRARNLGMSLTAYERRYIHKRQRVGK